MKPLSLKKLEVAVKLTHQGKIQQLDLTKIGHTTGHVESVKEQKIRRNYWKYPSFLVTTLNTKWPPLAFPEVFANSCNQFSNKNGHTIEILGKRV